jgi:hypothetical protein
MRIWRTQLRHGRLRGQCRREDALAAVAWCLVDLVAEAHGHGGGLCRQDALVDKADEAFLEVL